MKRLLCLWSCALVAGCGTTDDGVSSDASDVAEVSADVPEVGADVPEVGADTADGAADVPGVDAEVTVEVEDGAEVEADGADTAADGADGADTVADGADGADTVADVADVADAAADAGDTADTSDADAAPSGCEGSVDGTLCDDGNACTGVDRCVAGACVGEPGSEVVCAAPTRSCVLALRCEPATGLCSIEVPALAGSACEADKNTCTLEACDGAGACVTTGETASCADEAAADPCWTYECEPPVGCRRAALQVGATCDDEDACTHEDRCVAAANGEAGCEGTPLAVDDGNPCTDDACVDGEVTHTPQVGVSCEPAPVGWIRTFGAAGEDYGGMSHMIALSHTGTFLAVGTTTSADPNGDAYLIEVDDDGDLVGSHRYGGGASDSFTGITRFGAGYAACGGSLSYGGSRNKGYCVTLGADLAATSSNTYGGGDLTSTFDVIALNDTFISAGNTTDTDAWLDFVFRKHDANGAEVWTKYFGRSQDDTSFNVLAMRDGGFLLTGFTGGWSGCQQYYAIKTDANGDKLWDRTYGGCINNSALWQQLRQAVETEDGGFVATGSVVQDGQRSMLLQRFSATGEPVWTQTFGGAATEFGSGLVATRDGGFAIVGWTRSFGAGGDDIYLVKTNGDGVAEWERTFGGADDDQGSAILQLPDGGFLLGGTTRSWGAGGADIVLIRTDGLGQAPAEEVTNAWDRDTEPQVVSLDAQVTVGTLGWTRLRQAARYRVTRYSGGNYERVLETETTERTFVGQVGQTYRVEAIDPGGAVLDFVNVSISNLVAPSWTTGTFVDDFEDSTLAANYLNLKPHQVAEASGYLQLTQTLTDDYSAFYLPYDTQGRRYLRVSARLYQVRTNSQYTGGLFYFAGENGWKTLYFGNPWEDYRGWRGGQMRSILYRADPPLQSIEQTLQLDNENRFGAWFEYELVLDTVTGQASGRLGDETFPTVFPAATQFRPRGKVFILFTPYGWFTGHFLRVDDLRVESYD